MYIVTTEKNRIKVQLLHVRAAMCDVGHITSSLRAQQVNAIYRFVTMVY
jgi:hypothetical protein